jgi:hypothetical protein
MVSHTMSYSNAWLNNDLGFMSVRLMRLCFFVPISLPHSHRETRMQRRKSQRIDLQVVRKAGGGILVFVPVILKTVPSSRQIFWPRSDSSRNSTVIERGCSL